MSFMVVRGTPTEAQLFLDKVLGDILTAKATRPGVERPEDVNLVEIIYYCMRTKPNAIHMINGATGDKFTNEQILKRAVSIARAYRSIGASGKTVVSLLRNHEHMAAFYYGMLLAGVISYSLEPSTSGEDLQYFITVARPCMVLCEAAHRDDVTNALLQTGVAADVVVADAASIDEFTYGHSRELDSFELPNVGPEATALMLNTSGSTGRPGTVLLSHGGLIPQLPYRWVEGSKYPHPTSLVLHLTTGQWLSHAKLMNSCPVYRVPLLVSPTCTPNTPEKVVHLVEAYRPTYTFTNIYMAVALANMMSREQLSCFEMLGIAGTPYTEEDISRLKEKFDKSILIVNNYGITEMHGALAITTRNSPLGSVGEFHNFVHYKIVNVESGEEILEPNVRGELYLKSKYVIKGYLNNDRHLNVTPDGWVKTGDVFYKDEDGHMYFAYRRTLGFKSFNKTVYPEEVEMVVGSVPGVQQCVVCGADAGPAVAVVLRPGCDVTRDQIHHAIKHDEGPQMFNIQDLAQAN
ncbi:hypothetical protein MSG28_006008 [Choristoneura fumiferana]|uniref:Uncharacterized protein n=1 Tax=Choristoneura fumiferana TaxID=7141 RepID=A0ACC0L281_CHOFU|nr:hypothetical protein MSG28_006008 [Choristoneura fumiferana]